MPTSSELLTLAEQQYQSGNRVEAERLLYELLQADPRHAGAWHLCGVIAHQTGRHDAALDCIRQALVFDRANATFYSDLGEVYQALGDPGMAAACYRQALQLRPDLAPTHYNLGNVLLEQGKAAEAAAAYRKALRCKPDFAEAHNNLGIALMKQGQATEAIAAYQEAVRLKPSNVRAQNNLGNALRDQGRLDEAGDCFEQALRHQPDFAEAHNNVGNVLMDQGRLNEAVAHFRQALALQPGSAAAHSNLLYCLNLDPHAAPEEVFAEHCRWEQIQIPKVPFICGTEEREKGGKGEREKGRRDYSALSTRSPDLQPTAYSLRPCLRVGYVSPDFRHHPVTRFFAPILANHDPAQVEATCYSEVSAPDAETARLQQLAHGWRSTCGLSDAGVAEMVRADRIDILVDLAGHTANHRLGVFLHQPAPVQITYLGYPNTTGLTRIAYRLTDAVLDPPGEPIRHAEELVRLPGGFCCWAPPPDAANVTPLPALKTDRLTFGSLHRLEKMNAEVFDLWCEVLRAVPSSRLLMLRNTLIGPTRENILRQFTERGIDPGRVELLSRPPRGYWNIYGDIDIGLDVFPWTGHAISCESFWMGVPTLTLSGRCCASRLTASVLTSLGLTDWIARTPEEYVALAKNFADDRNGLAHLRLGLRERMRATLCDGARFTHELEAVYRELWRKWCNK